MEPITKFTECPHCASNRGYYIKLKVTGTSYEAYEFDGTLGDNTHLHDGLGYKRMDRYCYCLDCGEKIGENNKG